VDAKYARVAWRGSKLSEMSEDQLREALYQVYEQRKTAQQSPTVESLWAAFDAAFEKMDTVFDKHESLAQRVARRAGFKL